MLHNPGLPFFTPDATRPTQRRVEFNAKQLPDQALLQNRVKTRHQCLHHMVLPGRKNMWLEAPGMARKPESKNSPALAPEPAAPKGPRLKGKDRKLAREAEKAQASCDEKKTPKEARRCEVYSHHRRHCRADSSRVGMENRTPGFDATDGPTRVGSCHCREEAVCCMVSAN